MRLYFFPLVNVLVYVNCQHRPGHSLGEKINLHEMKKIYGLSCAQKCGKFEGFR